MTINVMLVDDSAVARMVIAQALTSASEIHVVSAADPIIAMEKMKDCWPDVIVLDVQLPRMDGITFLKKLMQERPTPVVICAALDGNNVKTSLDAMSAGATAVVAKPISNGKIQQEELSEQLIHEVRAAARARISRPSFTTSPIAPVAKPTTPPPPTAGIPTSKPPLKPAISSPAPRPTTASMGTPATSAKGTPLSTSEALANTMHERNVAPRLTADAMLPPPKGQSAQSILKTEQQIIAIGISTGGTQALEKLLPQLPENCPGLAIVQHMPESLTLAFAKRLNDLSKITVKEAKDGDQILPGQALISPGGKHLLVRRSGLHYFVDVKEGPLVNRHRPSVDVLFRSTAVSAGINATGIIMTGMGDDGARGLKEMFDCGAYTIAQDEASCTVFGMPKEAIKLGGVKETLSLERIALKISGK